MLALGSRRWSATAKLAATAHFGEGGLFLVEAASQARIVDVETHRPPIDEVVADLYEGWQARDPHFA